MQKILFAFLLLLSSAFSSATACSILYYKDSISGNIYAVSNEDYWYDVKPYIRIEPAGKSTLARLWFGWNDFAQGGINEAGLFFDGAATPEEPPTPGYSKPKHNLGDQLLSKCRTVDEAIKFLEEKKVALTNGHMLFGDSSGSSVVVEWVNGEKKLIRAEGNYLAITNFLLTDTAKGNYPCYRYAAMQKEIEKLQAQHDSIGLKQVGNIAARAVQLPAKDNNGKEAGTLYSVFVNISDMQLVLVYKLDNARKTTLDLRKEFSSAERRTIKME